MKIHRVKTRKHDDVVKCVQLDILIDERTYHDARTSYTSCTVHFCDRLGLLSRKRRLCFRLPTQESIFHDIVVLYFSLTIWI